MITRILYTEIWSDDFFMELSPEEKLLFIYFLTNDKVNIIHLYQCSNARIKADTGIDTSIIEVSKKKFERANKIYFKKNYVFLKNANRFENYTGDRNEIAKLKLFARLSKDTLEWYNNISDTPIHTPIIIPSINNKSKTINNKLKIREEDKHLEDIDPNSIPL